VAKCNHIWQAVWRLGKGGRYHLTGDRMCARCSKRETMFETDPTPFVQESEDED